MATNGLEEYGLNCLSHQNFWKISAGSKAKRLSFRMLRNPEKKLEIQIAREKSRASTSVSLFGTGGLIKTSHAKLHWMKQMLPCKTKLGLIGILQNIQ